MNIADRVQIDDIITGQNHEDWKSFTSDKNVSYVVDQQNGNYSNQVSWERHRHCALLFETTFSYMQKST